MKPLVTRKNNFYPYLLLFIQPIFMATNLIIARGGVEHVPPISLAFWRWLSVFLLLAPFFLKKVFENWQVMRKEFLKNFFLGAMGCGICGAFPFVAGISTTVTNMGIIYTSSPIFIILLSIFLFKDKISFSRTVGLIISILGVLIIICKGNISLLINFKFTTGDLWMIGAAMGWAVYSIFLINWKSKFDIMTRFTLISFFGVLSFE